MIRFKEKKRRDNLIRAHIIVSGRVQGVGYRAFVLEEANKIGLTGEVRNLFDISEVEIIAEGSSADIDKLVSKLWKGPSLSEVKNVDMAKEEIKQRKKTNFEITF